MNADKFPDEQSEIIETEEKATAENNITAIELSDAEILNLVRLAKNKVRKLQKILSTRNGYMNQFWQINIIFKQLKRFK